MGAEFIAEEGVLKGLILSLERGEEWTIGKDPDLSTIVIEDPKASRCHARVRKMKEGFYVENLSESNPVLIHGAPVSAPTLLHERDLVTIGGTVFCFYPRGAPFDYGFESEALFEEDEEAEEPFKEKEPAEKEISENIEEPLQGKKEPEKKPEGREKRAPSFGKEKMQEEDLDETLFEESEVPELSVDLTQTTRFILKVIAGPNTGAEFALDLDRSYLIGTDTATCDVGFNDLSVSREHARLTVSKEGRINIQDLGSRNGVVVDKERIIGTKTLEPNAVAALGTSAFLLIDREAPSETIAAPLFEVPAEEEKEEKAAKEEEKRTESQKPVAVKVPARTPFPIGTFILALFICGFAVLLGIGMVSLLQTKEVEVVQKDHLAELEAIIKQFPAVRFTYNKGSGKLFLMGHVKTGVEHNELLYQLHGLGFISGIDNNIVNDEAVWQEMNILLSKHPEFKGVSMHSPEAGIFVISGYLQTEKQAADLIDYLNVNFNYLSDLQNHVVVEQSVSEEVASRLMQQGFGGVNAALVNGELQLTGYVSSTDIFPFESLIEGIKTIPGVRAVRNFVVVVTPEQGVIDLNVKYQNKATPHVQRYRVTGYSKHGDVNVNVVINGRIIGRGDCIDGYTITSIQPHTIFMEKEGLKYKIEYNKCKSFGVQEE